MSAEICFAAVTLAISGVLLKNLGFRGAAPFAALSLIFLLSLLPQYIGDAVSLFDGVRLAGEGGKAILKIIGISYLFGISGDICRELGEGGIASALTLVGRFEILAVSLPFMKELIDAAMSLTAP